HAKARRPTQAKIRPGRPAPTMGPGVGATEKAFTSKPNAEKFTISPVGTPVGKGLTWPGKPLLKSTKVIMLPLSAARPARGMLNVSLQQIGPSSTGSFILKLTFCDTPGGRGFAGTYIPLMGSTPLDGTSAICWSTELAVNPATLKLGSPTSLGEKSKMLIVAAGTLVGPTKASAMIPVSNNSLLFMVSSCICDRRAEQAAFCRRRHQA